MNIRDRIAGLQRIKASELIPHPKNWRRHGTAQADALRGILAEIGYADALKVVKTERGYMILDGHLRAETTPDMDVPVLVLDVTPEEADKILLTHDPLAAMAVADQAAIAALMETVKTESPALAAMLAALAAGEPLTPLAPLNSSTPGPTLADRFIIPPFSVFDARQGYWQDRKRAWLALGIQSEVGRGGNHLGYSQRVLDDFSGADRQPERINRNLQQSHPATTATIDFYARKRQIEAELGRELSTDEAKTILAERGELKDQRAGNKRASARAFGVDLLHGEDPTLVPDNGIAPPSGSVARRQAGQTASLKGGTTFGTTLHPYDGASPDGDRMGQPDRRSADRRSNLQGAPPKPEWATGTGTENMAAGTSIFDPVLCEIGYRWFCRPGGKVLDIFAGGSVRGIVAAMLGRHYVGIELRPEQVAANRDQAEVILRHGTSPLLSATDTVYTDDPAELTPIQPIEVADGRAWIKREDTFNVNGSRGGKSRAVLALCQQARQLGVGVVTASSRYSPMSSRVARVAEALGVPCRVYLADSKELAEDEADAAAHGAELAKGGKVNYLTALRAKAHKYAQEHGWIEIPFGVESQEYYQGTLAQVRQLPPAERIVVTVGSGMTLAAIIAGLDELALDIPVLGVRVGADPSRLLDQWAPANWRERVEMVSAERDFNEPEAKTRWWGVELDPHYEAKAAPLVRSGDLFWNIAIRPGHELEAIAPSAPAPPTGPDWARGYPIDDLKTIASLFKTAGKGYAHGLGGMVRETQIAEWLDKGELTIASDDAGQPVAAILVHTNQRERRIEDFSGDPRILIEPGETELRRAVCLPDGVGALRSLIDGYRGRWFWLWPEHPVHRALASDLGLERWATQISAASEVKGLYAQRGNASWPQPEAPAERATLRRLNKRLDVRAAAEALGRLTEWAPHYSGYNKRGTWHALALRGYGGQPGFIEKPAEMSRQWKLEHPAELAFKLEDTPLRAQLPELEPLIKAIPGNKHRIRLMRLAAKQGELSRHADITDPDAGVGAGKTLRIHIPLITNPHVRFEQWNLDGEHLSASMAEGEAWYLDTRKPHTAINAGSTDRVHLVMDVESSPALLKLFANEAPASEREALILPPHEHCVLYTPSQASAPISLSNAVGTARWIEGDARDCGELAGNAGPFDMLFTCPPYGDLEVYSDDPRDLSAMEYEAFKAAYFAAIKSSCALLAPDAFALIVVGDYRDPKGIYRNFVSETISAFQAGGLQFYNDAVLITAVGSLPIRVRRQFESARKLGKTHQSVLCFVKGDPRRATKAIGPVEVGDIPTNEAAPSLEPLLNLNGASDGPQVE
jgi:1-aminocyclopropane-1-carboxylate deaminase/D-cysteine desulfhydrase-like pyridoxal-dependent ACC family enzyme